MSRKRNDQEGHGEGCICHARQKSSRLPNGEFGEQSYRSERVLQMSSNRTEGPRKECFGTAPILSTATRWFLAVSTFERRLRIWIKIEIKQGTNDEVNV